MEVTLVQGKNVLSFAQPDKGLHAQGHHADAGEVAVSFSNERFA